MSDKSTSQTLKNGLTLLSYFRTQGTKLGLRELTDKLGISTTAVSRLLNTLIETGYLNRDPSTGKYELGFNAYMLGLYTNPYMTLKQLAWPYIEMISEETKETVSLNIIDSLTLEGVCLASKKSSHEIGFSSPVGLSRPLTKGASRKILLAFMPPEQREIVYQRTAREDSDFDTTTLDAELKEIRHKGFAHTEEEVFKGALNVSAPILSEEGYIVAGLSIHSPVYRKNDNTVEHYSTILVKAAENISRSLKI